MNSTITGCYAKGSAAAAGAAFLYHGKLAMHASHITHCHVDADGFMAEGGAVYARRGTLLMSAATEMMSNELRDAHGQNRSGSTMHVGAATVAYVLPTTDAHWLSSIRCRKVWNVCPEAAPCFGTLCYEPGAGPAGGECELTSPQAICCRLVLEAYLRL